MATKVKISEFLAYYEPHAIITNGKAPNPPPKEQYGYVMGGDGRIATESYLLARAKRSYPNGVEAYVKRTTKWLGREVYDCNAVAESFYKRITGVSIDTKARSNYSSWCGTKSPTAADRALTGLPQYPGVAVFSGSSAKSITHVGYLLRKYDSGRLDWYVLEARGADYGLVITKLAERSWAWWGVMDKYFEYDLDVSWLKVGADTGVPAAEKGGNGLNLHKLILTNNECYEAGRTIAVKGIMVHSTGANNPNLRRYVGPDDGLLGVNSYGNHWNTARPGGRQVCVHAFIGKLKDGTIATYQTLPWNHRGWHGGGSSNNTHIGFEICEDALSDATYFQKVYQEAAELCAYLCKEFDLDPTADGVLICHCEGYKRGIASNHGDVMHWWPKFGKNMDTFRSDVAALLGKPSTNPPTSVPAAPDTHNTLEFAKGDTVEFTGSKHYSSSNSTNGKSCKPGKAQVTNVAKAGKHPYHLVRVQGGGSTVYGWVDAADIKTEGAAAIVVGSKVKVKPGAKTYTGGKLASFVYSTTYYVRQLKGDRAVIAPAKTGAITAAIKVSDLILQ